MTRPVPSRLPTTDSAPRVSNFNGLIVRAIDHLKCATVTPCQGTPLSTSSRARVPPAPGPLRVSEDSDRKAPAADSRRVIIMIPSLSARWVLGPRLELEVGPVRLELPALLVVCRRHGVTGRAPSSPSHGGPGGGRGVRVLRSGSRGPAWTRNAPAPPGAARPGGGRCPPRHTQAGSQRANWCQHLAP